MEYNPVYEAYRVLLKVFNDADTDSGKYVDPADATEAIEEALGYLGEALDD